MITRKIDFERLDFNPDDYLEKLLSKNEGYNDEEDEKTPQTYINSPMGIESVLDPFALTRHFEFFIAHTNFNISPMVFKLVETTPGVDLIRPLTRYRILLAFGRMFDVEDVKDEIRSRLIEPNDEVKEMIAELEDAEVEYCIYISEKGVKVTTEMDENFESMREIFKEAKIKHGGEIIESE